MQLATVERAFRVLKSELLLRPIWHHYSGRTQAHVFICVLAYALWKTLVIGDIELQTTDGRRLIFRRVPASTPSRRASWPPWA